MWSINVIQRLPKAIDFFVVVIIETVVIMALLVVTGHLIFSCGQ